MSTVRHLHANCYVISCVKSKILYWFTNMSSLVCKVYGRTFRGVNANCFNLQEIPSMLYTFPFCFLLLFYVVIKAIIFPIIYTDEMFFPSNLCYIYIARKFMKSCAATVANKMRSSLIIQMMAVNLKTRI